MFVLRLIFTTTRATLLAASIIVTGWFLAVAPTEAERRLLSATDTTNDMRLREAVVQMRLARAALALAPDLAVTLIQRQSGGRASRDEVERVLRAIAAGRPLATETAAPAQTQRQSGGAKFVKAPG